MRIVIDMQGAQSESRHRGIGRYTISFVKALLQKQDNHDYFLVLNGDLPESIQSIRDEFRSLIHPSHILLWHQPHPGGAREAKNRWRRRASELIRESLILSLNPDVVHITSFFEGYVDGSTMSIDFLQEHEVIISVTLYDLIPLLNSADYLDPEPKYKKYYLSQINQFRNANLFLGISNFSCNQAIELISLDPKTVINVSAATASEFQNNKSKSENHHAVLERHGLVRNFILCVGGGDTRKNIPRLVGAYASLSANMRESYDLVLVGPNLDGGKIRSYLKLNASGRVRVLDHVSDDDLSVLYQACSIFVYPSLSEGFGLPPLEAMSYGAPVISSNSTSLPEVINFPEALFDATSIGEIGEKISEALNDDNFRLRLIEHGKLQATLFSWSDTADKALNAINSLVSDESTARKKRTILSADSIYRSLVSRISSIPRDLGSPSDHDLILCAKSIADTFPKRPITPRIFIDISELVQRDSKTGVQRVTRSILYELLMNPPPGYLVEPVYANIETVGYKFARSFARQFIDELEFNGDDDLIDPQVGDLFLGLDLQHHTTRFQANYIQSMRRSGVLIYFVVYDLLPIQFPHFWPPAHQVARVHEEWLKVVCEGDGAICISKSVSDELSKWMFDNSLKRPNFEISWFHLGADLQSSLPTKGFPEESHLLLNNLAKRKSFLLVGTIEPRKGHSQVLDSFDILWGQGYEINLVLVGKQGWNVDSLIMRIRTHPEIGRRLFWLEGVSDAFLSEIYKSCVCLIFASEGEGFGLPLIEAAHHGIPIIARDIPVFREVAGSGAFYFEGLRADDLAGALRRWLVLNQDGKIPSSSEISWLSWKESTQQLLAALKIN